jgi:ATP-dependent DNA ligase
VFTSDFPHVANAAQHLPPDTLLDGELVAIDQSGRVSFNLLQHHRSQAQAILFYAFDVIIHRGRSLRHVPLEDRRELLSDIVGELTRTCLIGLSDTIDATPAELIPLVKEFGFEGIIAKRKDSCYESGKRSGAWLKYKVNKAQAFVIGGYTPDNPLDALIVGYYEGDKLLFASKVRNGFVPRLRREVWAKLKDLQTDACPFANLPKRNLRSGR